MKKFANGYEINWMNNTVTVTKDFHKAANEFGTDEFALMLEFRKMGLTVMVRKIAERKPQKRAAGAQKPFGRPTYRQMLIHINNSDDAVERLPEFEKVKDEAKAQPNAYQYVLDWFKVTYPNFREIPSFNKVLAIVNDPNTDEAAVA